MSEKTVKRLSPDDQIAIVDHFANFHGLLEAVQTKELDLNSEETNKLATEALKENERLSHAFLDAYGPGPVIGALLKHQIERLGGTVMAFDDPEEAKKAANAINSKPQS